MASIIRVNGGVIPLLTIQGEEFQDVLAATDLLCINNVDTARMARPHD